MAEIKRVVADPAVAPRLNDLLNAEGKRLVAALGDDEFGLGVPLSDEAGCRNPSRSGYGIPLMTLGQSRTFYPDFLAWTDDTVFGLDTKGGHIIQGELGRKLLAIAPHPRAKRRLAIRLISPGHWSSASTRESGEGFTVWSLGAGNALKPMQTTSVSEAVALALASGRDA